MSHAKAITNGLFTSLDPDSTRLIGSRCTECDNHSFPAMNSCSRCCGTSLEKVELGRHGILWTWTSQSFMPPSPPYSGPEKSPDSFIPFLLGMVELPGQCRVISRILADTTDEFEIGTPMELTLFPYRDDEAGNTVVSYAFKPVSN